MPYSWNRPPVPIDKSKQGGRNFDSSTYTDFRKIGTIAAVNSTKIDGTKNKNLYSNIDEKRRADVLISSLKTIPRALCPTCPVTVSNNAPLPEATVTTLKGVTFFVIYSESSVYYANNTIYSSLSPLTILTNSYLDTFASIIRVGNADSLSTLPVNASRNDIITTLNTRLATHTWNSGASYLQASIDVYGRLVLSIVGTQLPPSGTNLVPSLAGLFFGDSPNGSTTLGVTNQNGISGVGGSALLITEGETSVTAPYVIANI